MTDKPSSAVNVLGTAGGRPRLAFSPDRRANEILGSGIGCCAAERCQASVYKTRTNCNTGFNFTHTERYCHLRFENRADYRGAGTQYKANRHPPEDYRQVSVG